MNSILMLGKRKKKEKVPPGLRPIIEIWLKSVGNFVCGYAFVYVFNNFKWYTVFSWTGERMHSSRFRGRSLCKIFLYLVVHPYLLKNSSIKSTEWTLKYLRSKDWIISSSTEMNGGQPVSQHQYGYTRWLVLIKSFWHCLRMKIIDDDIYLGNLFFSLHEGIV